MEGLELPAEGEEEELPAEEEEEEELPAEELPALAASRPESRVERGAWREDAGWRTKGPEEAASDDERAGSAGEA